MIGMIGKVPEDTLGTAYDIGNPPSIHDSVKEQWTRPDNDPNERVIEREREVLNPNLAAVIASTACCEY